MALQWLSNTGVGNLWSCMKVAYVVAIRDQRLLTASDSEITQIWTWECFIRFDGCLISDFFTQDQKVSHNTIILIMIYTSLSFILLLEISWVVGPWCAPRESSMKGGGCGLKRLRGRRLSNVRGSGRVELCGTVSFCNKPAKLFHIISR